MFKLFTTRVQTFAKLSSDGCNWQRQVIPDPLQCTTGDRYSTLRPYITSAPSAIHWLPVCQRVHFKVATFVHQSLSVADARGRRLRSTASRTCVVTRTFSTFGDRAFSAAWTRTVEQSSIAPERRWLIVQWIPAVVKDISVWTVGPRRSVNFINCAD